MVTNVSSVTPTSVAPNRGQAEEDYSDTADAWAASITVTTTSWNNSISEFNTAAEEVNVLAEETEANKNAAVSAVNAETWVTGTNYVVGDGVYSPITLLTYRAKNDQTPSTTDPSLDPTNWQDLSGTLPDQAGEDGKFLQTNSSIASWEDSFSGPPSSTLNAVVRFADTGGNDGKNSVVIIDDSGNITGVADFTIADGTLSVTRSTGVANGVFIDQNVNSPALNIDNSGTNPSINISGSSTGPVFFGVNNSITSNPLMRVETNSASASSSLGLLRVFSDDTGSTAVGIGVRIDAANGNHFVASRLTAGDVCRILNNGDLENANGVYGTISDRKTKQDITEGVRSYTDDFLKLQYRKYRRKVDVEEFGEDAPWLIGLVSDEVTPIFPGCVIDYLDTEEIAFNKPVERTKSIQVTIETPDLDEKGQEIFRPGKRIIKEHVEFKRIDEVMTRIIIPEYEEDYAERVTTTELLFNEDGSPSMIEVFDLDENGELQFDATGEIDYEGSPSLDENGEQTITQSVKSSVIDGVINSIVLQEQIKELRALKAELKAAGLIS